MTDVFLQNLQNCKEIGGLIGKNYVVDQHY